MGLDVSKVSQEARFKGLEIELHRHPGARVLRVVHPGRQKIDEHRHDWSYIGVYMLGRYREIYDGGEALMSGPCAAFHPAGRPHADLVDESGLETLTVEFDLQWLRGHGFDGRLDRSRVWSGGAVGLASRNLARSLSARNATEADIGAATSRFLHIALGSDAALRPSWLKTVEIELESVEPPSTRQIARKLDLHPAWLARAYRAASGEGIHQTLRRKRVERASMALRRTDLGLADVAVDAGFCDQSHMNRSFRALIGRTPLEVRAERSI